MRGILLLPAVLANINPECPSGISAKACEEDCETIHTDCYVQCGEDTTCITDCTRMFASCMDQCPCHTECFDGCPCEYENDYCQSCTENLSLRFTKMNTKFVQTLLTGRLLLKF